MLVPCAFLWLLSPVEYIYNQRSTGRGVRTTWLYLAKSAVAFLLVALSLAELGNDIWLQQRQQEPGSGILVVGADFIAASAKAVTYFLSWLLMYNTKKSGRITSVIQVTF